MKIPTEFNGRVSAFMNPKTSYIAWLAHDDSGKCWADADNDFIRLSNPQPISCKFFDTRAAQVDQLEKQIEKERAESQFRINQMMGKIQELQALEVSDSLTSALTGANSAISKAEGKCDE